MMMGKGAGQEAREAGSEGWPSKARTRRAIATWLRLAKFVSRQHSVLGARLRDNGLSLAQFDAIAQIGASEGLTQRELADRLVVTQGNVTQLLQKLESRRLIVRPQSGRCNSVRLTAAGRSLHDGLVPGQERAVARLFLGLTDRELETLSRLLRKMTRTRREQNEERGESPGGGLT